jgi:hypothetical protein
LFNAIALPVPTPILPTEFYMTVDSMPDDNFTTLTIDHSQQPFLASPMEQTVKKSIQIISFVMVVN